MRGGSRPKSLVYPNPQKPGLKREKRGGKRGVFRLVQGAGLMGKSWQKDRRKQTPFLSLLYEGLASCTAQRKGGDRIKGKQGNAYQKKGGKSV